MKSHKYEALNRLAPYFAIFFIVNLFFSIIRAQGWWHFLNVTAMSPSFADLRAYTSAVTCAEKGVDYLEESCDPWGRKIGLLKVYIPIFRFLHLDESQTVLVGNSLQVLLFFAILSLAFAMHIDLRNMKSATFVTLFLISPPFALIIERGNLEIVLFMIISISTFLIFANQKIIAYVLLGFISILKLYPIFLLACLLTYRQIKNSKIQLFSGLFIFAAALAGVLFSLSNEGRSLWSTTLPSSPNRTFGVTTLPYLLSQLNTSSTLVPGIFEVTSVGAQIIGTVLFLVMLVVLSILRSKRKVFKPDLSILVKKNDFISHVFLIFLCMLFLSYFVVSSYDYRMIYFAPILLIGLRQLDFQENRRNSQYLVYGTTIAMWSQINNWTSALVQIPMLVILAITLFNIALTLVAGFTGKTETDKPKKSNSSRPSV